MKLRPFTRRDFLTTSAVFGGATLAPRWTCGADADRPPAHVAITLDLEMSANFPRWEDTHWNFEKGNLDEDTKKYAVEVARQVKARGGAVHFFLVARVLEQDDVDWLLGIIRDGHRVGNHTYDHVNVKATRPAEIQARFQRAPWLIEGQSPAAIIRENIRLASAVMKSRLGIEPAGFRTPGGYANGLADRPDVQQMLLELGFKWVSAKYPAHLNNKPGEETTPEIFASIVQGQAAAQPFVYPSGLIEVPMSPISDIGAFRNGRWKLDQFLQATRQSLEWAIEHRQVFDFLCHPSCLGVVDPQFRTIDLICDLVQKAGEDARFADLETVAGLAR